MKDYRLSEIHVGLKEGFFKTITSEMMLDFFNLTGDENPLHVDKEFAAKRGFDSCVVYGMLTASLISTLGGCYLPGKNCLIQGVEIKFSNPVFVGDTLYVEGEVSKVDLDLRYVEIKVSIKNQDSVKVLRGLLKVGVLDEQE